MEWWEGNVMMEILSSCFVLPLLGFLPMAPPHNSSWTFGRYSLRSVIRQVYFFWFWNNGYDYKLCIHYFVFKNLHFSYISIRITTGRAVGWIRVTTGTENNATSILHTAINIYAFAMDYNASSRHLSKQNSRCGHICSLSIVLSTEIIFAYFLEEENLTILLEVQLATELL